MFRIIHARQPDAFYSFASAPGVSERRTTPLDPGRFALLDDPRTAAGVVEFDDGRVGVATFSIPSIHCASCVWLLEQLWRFDAGAHRAEVNLERRSLRVEYGPAVTSPRRIAEQLAALGYEPALSAEGSGTRAAWRYWRLRPAQGHGWFRDVRGCSGR